MMLYTLARFFPRNPSLSRVSEMEKLECEVEHRRNAVRGAKKFGLPFGKN